ncbi:MAG: hypothetical protein JSV10_07085 [Candidatus Zixiibacteriota bacterium]|nr:MAG: hypothetical protein JSV10_07085 [candidate division Zixibacteria bacterium]
MRRTLLLASVCLLMLCLFQASCEKRTVGPVVTDWDAVKEIVSRYPSVFRLGFFGTEPDTESFYREITSSYADIEEGELFNAEPDYIILTWGDSLLGKLHYDSSGQSHEKPIVFKARTRAYFERLGTINDPDLGWLLRRISGTIMNSPAETTQAILELRVASEALDTVIWESRMKDLFGIDSTLVFGKEKQVTFVVEPADTTDSLFLHVREGEAYQKIPFVRVGEETFSASWTTTDSPEPGRHYYHAIVDLVSQESLAADSTEYEFKAWGIVYRIK